MHDAPRLRGGVVARVLLLVAGLFLFAAGLSAVYQARLGLSAWDVLNQGVARHTPLSFGFANTAVALLIVLGARTFSSRLGPGTLLNAVLVGSFVQLQLGIPWVEHLDRGPLSERAALLGAGIGLVAAGSALYIGAQLGAGPRDSLMLGLAQRTGRRIGVVRAVLEGGACILGFALGGSVGVGTIVFTVAVGPAVELGFAGLVRCGLARPEPAAAIRACSRLRDAEEAVAA